MKFELPEIKSEKQKNNINEKLCLEDFDIDNLILKTQKQYIKDSVKIPHFANKVIALGINIEEIENIDDEKFNELLNDTSLRKLLDQDFEIDIEETYENIIDMIKKGKKPIVTVEPKFLQSVILNGLKIETHKNTYDKQILIAGTIGREPLDSGQRIICQINNISLDNITPRSTGKDNKNNSFNFNGVIVFNKNIKPSDIEIISLPKFLLPPNIKLPITADKLKHIYN